MTLPYTNLASTLERLDARDTGYQIDVDADIPWDCLDAPGEFVPADFIRDLGLDADALLARPEAWELFQWSAALQICEGFTSSERDLLDGLHSEPMTGVLSHRSAQLLHDEEEKHIAMFKRFANHLREQRPMWAFDFDTHAAAIYEKAVFDALELAPEGATWHYLFWAATVYFEETTIYMHARLPSASGVQPAWAAMHKAHMKEEVQHLRTDMAHLAALPLDTATTDAVILILPQVIADTIPISYGTSVAQRMIVGHFPDLDLVAQPDVRQTPVWDHVMRSHPVFKRTRDILQRVGHTPGGADVRPA